MQQCSHIAGYYSFFPLLTSPGQCLLASILLLACSTIHAGVENTAHNLIKGVTGIQDEQAVCLPCHTPASKSVQRSNPVWDKRIVKNTDSYAVESLLESGPNNAIIGGNSLACLACHDETQAKGIDNTYNRNLAEQSSAKSIRTRKRTIEVAPRTVTAIKHPGKSLSHPVGIPYGQKESQQTHNDTATRNVSSDTDFNPVSRATINARTVWWIETGRPGRQKTDLPLYSRQHDTGATPTPYIECASCHDPHMETPKFLRTPNNRSQLCLSCHNL